MLRLRKALYYYVVLLWGTTLLFPSCKNVPSYINKTLVLPCAVSEEYSFCYVNIIKGNDCLACSISSLYQWESIVRMVGREDMLFLFIVEPNPETSEESIRKALLKHPFNQPLYFDAEHVFIEQNPWLKQHDEIDGLVIEMKNFKIVAQGNPMKSLDFLRFMRELSD